MLSWTLSHCLSERKQEFNDKVARLENEKQQLKTTFDEERTRITKEKEQFAAEARKKDEAYTRIQMEKQKSDQAYQKQIVDKMLQQFSCFQ